MVDENLRTFEQLKAHVRGLRRAPSATERLIGFVDEDRSLAVSRDETGRVEVFLVGTELIPSRPALRRAMEFRADWQCLDGTNLAANRLVLARDPYFDSAAALICVELMDAGFAGEPAGVFAQVETLIEKFIAESVRLGSQVLVGLFGELSLLDALAARAPGQIDELVLSWAGWGPSSRDFQLGQVGVEVKTTAHSTSVHHVQGFHQVEVGHPVTDVAETSLFMLSLGVRPLAEKSHAGQTVPSLVEQVSARISSPEIRSGFLARVQQYGGDAASGYNHVRDRFKDLFQTRYMLMFERLYDLSDENLRILRRSDLAGFAHLEPDSVTFKVTLPYPFRGVVNPITGMDAICERLLRAAATRPG